jgi:hypothetical protein
MAAAMETDMNADLHARRLRRLADQNLVGLADQRMQEAA